MAGVRIVYIGGGSTRAPGTMAAFVERGAGFAGSELVLVDIDEQRLDVVPMIYDVLPTRRME